jgi:transposase InsO family protein
LSKHKALIDCTKKSVNMTTPDGKEIEFFAEPVVTAKGDVNHVKVNQMGASQGSEVAVVNEFPDVFPEELPGMPPDRDIEFVIDVKPGTAPTYKTPFRIVCLHGVPKNIVSDRGTQFTSRFWERLHETLDTQLRFNFAYHPQIDGQTERVNKILEDMLRVCALQYRRSWDKSLPYTEFSYNNSYQESLKMVPFEMLYGHRCRTPLF